MVFAVKTEKQAMVFSAKNTRNAGVFLRKTPDVRSTAQAMPPDAKMPTDAVPSPTKQWWTPAWPNPAAHLPWLLWWLPDLIPSSHREPTQWCGFINMIVCSKFVRYSFTDLIQHYNEINCHRCGDSKTDLICHRKTKRDLFSDLGSSRVGYTFT